jgi:hypothetical protein
MDSHSRLEERARLPMAIQRRAWVVEGPCGHSAAEDGLGEEALHVSVHVGGLLGFF